MKSLDAILDEAEANTVDVLASNPPVNDVEPEDLDADDLPDGGGKTWSRVDEIVAVFVDLQSSTKLSVGKHPQSTAAIYAAATGNAVKVLHDFEADFIQVQGDGAFGLFWGEKAIERAICAGITVKTFSEKVLEPKLEAKWPDAPATGFKVGVASGRVLVKKIGTPRNPNEQEPVWAGKPVNYAAKAAQQADRRQLIVTGSVWVAIEDNDYLTTSCAHADGTSPAVLWSDVNVEHLDHDEDEAAGRMLKATWCDDCGPDFVTAILSGETNRPESDDVRESAISTADKVRAAHWDSARARRAHRRGLKSGRRK